MTDLLKAARKCDQCGRYQAREHLTAIADDDGSARHICDDCQQNAEKAAAVLDGFRVTAYTPGGTEEATTVAKALGMGALAKSAADRRAEWRKAVEVMDAAIAKMPYIAGGEVAKAEAMDRLRKADPIARFGAMVKALQQEDRENRAAQRLAALVKSELTRRRAVSESEELNRKASKKIRKTAKIIRKSERLKLQVADSRAQIDGALAEFAAAQSRLSEVTADASARIDAIISRLEAGQKQARILREAPAIAAKAKRDQERAHWIHQASLVRNDDIRRQAYLNRAEGIFDED